jgi:hypothetical protein
MSVQFFGHVKGKDGYEKYGNALLSAAAPVRSQPRTPTTVSPGDAW